MSGPARRPQRPDPVSRLLRSGSIYTLATAAQLGAGFLVLPALTRILDAGVYGTVAAALVIYQLLGLTVGLGLPGAITRAYFHRDDRDHGRQGTLGLIWATALAAIGCAVVLELTGPAWAALFEGLDYGGPLRIAVWASVPFAVLQAAQSVLRSDERPRPYVVAAIAATALAQAFGLVGAAIGGATEYMAGMSLGVTVAAIYSIRACGAAGSLRIHGEILRRNLRIGLPTVPHALALYVIAAGDRVVIERLEGLADLARYHVAFLVGFTVILLSAAINNAWAPIVYGAEGRRWELLADTAATVLRVAALTIASLALLAPLALRIAAPSGYEVGGLDEVTILVAVSALPYVFYLACAHVILWRAQTIWLALITPPIAALNVLLNIVLIPAHGLVGAAVATLIAYLVLALALLAVTRRVVKVPWRWRSAAISAAIALAAAAVALALPDDEAWVTIRAVAGLVVAFVLVTRVANAARPSALA